VLLDGADAKGWYVSLSRARDSMYDYTRDEVALRQSVMYPREKRLPDLELQLRRRHYLEENNMVSPHTIDIPDARLAAIRAKGPEVGTLRFRSSSRRAGRPARARQAKCAAMDDRTTSGGAFV
jgi:hypothetical protein